MSRSKPGIVNAQPSYEGLTGDKRLDHRARDLWQQLANKPCSTISNLSENRAEQVAYYRLLENEKLSEEGLISELRAKVSLLVEDRDILCIEDTCEVNLVNNKNRLKPNSGMGKSANSENHTCFKLHPGLVLDADSFHPLGFSDVEIFHHPEEMPDRIARNYKRSQ